jgi:hypothetical protein
MSENSSPISAVPSGENEVLTADLDLRFDGAEDILRTWRRGMRPDPDLTVSEWADQHRSLSPRASAEPGRYRTTRTPYLREIMDALSPRHPAQRISFMKAAQVGAAEAGNNWIGFVIHHAPGPMLAVLPTVEMAKRTSRGRLDPLIADSPALRERVKSARSRDAGNLMLSKEFPGGILVLTGANSATSLRSMPARYIFLDEVDAYPASADEEGDPVTLAVARATTFSHRRKVFMVSTPTIRGLSRIEREWELSDQQRYRQPPDRCLDLVKLSDTLEAVLGDRRSARCYCGRLQTVCDGRGPSNRQAGWRGQSGRVGLAGYTRHNRPPAGCPRSLAEYQRHIARLTPRCLAGECVHSPRWGRISEGHAGRGCPTPRSIIAGKGPEVSGFGFACLWIKHRGAGLVHE